MEDLTEAEAYRRAYNVEKYDLTELIDPSEVIEGATKWSDISDEKLRQECYKCIEYGDLLQKQQNIIFERTFTLVKESLTRVIDSDVITHLLGKWSEKRLVAKGMWTGDMSHGDLWEIIHDLEPWGYHNNNDLEVIWSECKREARETAESAKADALNPRQEPRY